MGGTDQRHVSLKCMETRYYEQSEGDQMVDCSTRKEQNDTKIFRQF